MDAAAKARKLKRIAEAYAQASIDLSWIGNTHPDEHNGIRQRYAKARRKLHDSIDAAIDEAEVFAATKRLWE